MKKVMIFLLILEIVFAILFIIGILNLRRGIPTFGIGIPADIENWMVIILSLIGIVRFFWEIVKH